MSLIPEHGSIPLAALVLFLLVEVKYGLPADLAHDYGLLTLLISIGVIGMATAPEVIHWDALGVLGVYWGVWLKSRLFKT